MASTTELDWQEGRGEGHVAVLAFPFTSHATTLLTLIRHLASSTPDTIYSFFSTSKSNATNFASSHHTNNNNNNVKPYDVEDGVPDGYVFSGMRHEDIKLFLEAAPGNFTKQLKTAVADTGRKVSVLVTDAFLWFAADIAEEFQVPWICVWTSAFLSLSTHVHTNLIKDFFSQGEISGREDETLPFVPGMANIRLRDLADGIVIGHSPVFPGMLRQMVKALPETTAIFVNSFEELEPDIANDMKSKLKQSYTIGPFNQITGPSPASDEYRCLPWLDKQKLASVAYISFGTAAIIPEKEMVALAEALEGSGVPFLWSLKEHLQKKLPKGFLERTKQQGMVVPWAPQVDVLSHLGVGVFLTHCGWQSLLQSIAGGVPMICRPCFGDQRINTRLTTEIWKIGLMVDGGMFTKDAMESMLNDFIQSTEKWREMRENVVALKHAAERAVGPDGSSTHNLRLLLKMVSSNAF